MSCRPPVQRRRCLRGSTQLQLFKLEAEASRDAQGNVYLMVVNQDVTDDVTASIEIVGNAADATMVHTLNGASATATTHAVTEARVRLEGGALRHTFPAHSLTALTFPAR